MQKNENFSGFYLDVMQGCSLPCYWTPHGHSAAGGDSMSKGMHDMVKSITNAVKAEDPHAITTGENTAENMIDVTDAALQVTLWPENTVPIFATVYQDYFLRYGLELSTGAEWRGRYKDTWREDAFFIECGSMFVEGMQVGRIRLRPRSNMISFQNPNHKEMLDFLKRFVDYYKQPAARKFLSYGQLLRPLSFDTPAPMPMLQYQSYLNKSSAEFPALMSGVFAAEDRQLGVFVVNAGPAPLAFEAQLDPSHYGLPDGPVDVDSIASDGATKSVLRNVKGVISLSASLPLHGVTMFLLSASDSEETADQRASRFQLPDQRPANGWVGGPYKVKAVDVTGDDIVDLVVSHYPIDVVTVEKGNGRGEFARHSLFQIPYDDHVAIDPVYNIDTGDIDGDGLLDLAIGIGGSNPYGYKLGGVPQDVLRKAWRGRVVLAMNMGNGIFERQLQYSTQSPAKGVALADLDNDGQLNLLHTERGSGYKGDTKVGKLLIRQGLGNWEFGPAIDSEAGPSAYYVETGDLNNDGFLDILVPNEHAPSVYYFVNPGKEIFAEPDSLRQSRRVVRASQMPERHYPQVNDVRAVDLNNDGDLDLVTANLQTATFSTFIGNGDGTFQKDTLLDGGKYNAFLAVDDLDNDGDNDIVVTHWSADSVAVLLNKGDGQFAPRTDYKTDMRNYGVTIFDADGDGELDIVTANYVGRTISLLKGSGDGTFAPAVNTLKGLRQNNGDWIPLQ